MEDAMNINELLAKGCKVSNGEHLQLTSLYFDGRRPLSIIHTPDAS